MKHKATKQFLSILLAVVMLMGVLPMAAIPVFAATTYTKAGEVGAVTAECEAFTEPELGAVIKGDFNFTVTSPSDQRVSITSGYSAYWEKFSYGLWEKYTEAAFNEGTYRLKLTMNSFAFSDGSYYALSSSTTLTLNDVSFTAGKLYDDYDSQGKGSLIFYSPEYTVAKEAGTYLVTVTAGSNGLASADKVYGKTGEVVTLTAQPYDGYRLKEWRVLSGGVTVENNRFTIGSEDVEIKAIFESSNENQGNITQVEVTKKEGVDYRPVMGRSPERIFVTIQSSTPSDDTLGVGGYGYGIWEVKQPDGSWEYCMGEPFTYGTYRMCISLDNKVVDGKYHALTKNTVLIVDGEAWAADPYSYVNYYGDPNGRGEISFNSPEMDVIPLATVSDSTPVRCYVKPVLGEFAVPLGDDFSFTVEPKDYYELTDPDALKVYVNDILVTPDADGVYTVENVTEDLDIYCDGSGFTGYSNLIISANGKTVTEKVYMGGTYTFKTLEAFGVAAPAGSAFTGWKIGGKTYQPGDTYTVVGNTEIKVTAAFKGLHNITVENGKAYADEAHTIPISAAAEDQVIYIVADPAPEGKVFSYWTEIEITSPGGDGWFGSYDAAQTTYTVYYSDVVLAPVYETSIDHIVIGGMTKPSAGVAIDNSDYSYKWGCSVPANSGYTLGICYWYDITDGEPEFAMSDGDVFQIGHTYRYKAKISLYGDTILAAKEDISVALTGLDADSYTWTISEYSQIYENMVIYFEFTCEREEPDTALIRPKGDGTSGNPFQITNIGELYWFAAFVNYTISIPSDLTVTPNWACAKLMNDITVNPDLLTDDYTLNEDDTDLLAAWNPLCTTYFYKGTFDGQNHTISGIYCVPQPTRMIEYGLFGRVVGGCICNLTLKDSYFRTPLEFVNNMGGFVGRLTSDSTVENCHFDGTVTTTITKESDVSDYYMYGRIAGIVCMADEESEIRDCTVKGLICGYGQLVGGIVGSADGEVIGCVNEATVKNTKNDEEDTYTGGIAAISNNGTISDCCNKGTVIGNTAGGIVDTIDENGTVKNCHFDGSVVSLDGEGSEILGGIAATNSGNIQNCTVNGEVSGYATNALGGIVGVMVQGSVTDCVNEARVENLVSLTGRDGDFSGGIVGTMATGTIRDCCNKGYVSGNNSGGIVGGAGWAYNEGATIIRCWNEGAVENGAGIASTISGDNVTIKNCYNVGPVRYGIISSYAGSGHSVTYCHNVGELTAGFNHGAPIIPSADDTEINVANCYYLADSESDTIEGTTYKTADQFADGTVLALLNNGHWTQGEDDEYPVLGDAPGVTVSGMATSFNSDTDNVILQLIAEGYSEADYEVFVKGNTASYTIEGVAPGTYTMKVMKQNHVTREYTVTVGSSNVVQDVKIHLKGDITGDGKVNTFDIVKMEL